jgi:putative chitinase
MTVEELVGVMPNAVTRAAVFAPAIAAACQEFEITTPLRVAAFLAQAAQETGELRWMRELASGEAYEHREDLGNSQPGDGARCRGGGLMMLTGRFNWMRCERALGLPLLENPDLILQPDVASRSGAWFWKDAGLNEIADQDRFGAITRRINGGYTDLDKRLAFFYRARKVFGL